MNRRYRAVMMSGVLVLSYCSTALSDNVEPLMSRAKALFQPLPDSAATAARPTPANRVNLGRALFFDTRLSIDGTVSCRTCHIPELYGTDGLPKAVGVEHRQNARNAPTILNAALGIKAHWDGGREDVEDQATKAFIGPKSFGNPDFPAVMKRLEALGYKPSFDAAFPEHTPTMTPETLGLAIGSYERTLLTPAPFDRYLQGDDTALSPPAKEGLKLFMERGCAQCHAGPLLGGRQFQKFGLFKDYWTLTGSLEPDEGRFLLTHQEGDRYVFKVPGLRNVAMTPPYFHDGSVEDLRSAIRIMGQAQLGQNLTDPEVESIEAFLNTLTGTQPKHFSPLN